VKGEESMEEKGERDFDREKAEMSSWLMWVGYVRVLDGLGSIN